MNNITLSGEITEKGIKVIRESGIADELPIDDDFAKGRIGQKVCLVGHLRTRNIDGHVPLDVVVDARFPYDRETNLFEGIGVLCKKPILRKTPLTNKDICDALISFDCYENNKLLKAYVPCIAWNKNARLLATEEVGTRFYIIGRLQSRVYKKNDKEYTTYELSIETIERRE